MQRSPRTELIALSAAIVAAFSSVVNFENASLGLLATQQNRQTLKAQTALALEIWSATEAPRPAPGAARRTGQPIATPTLRPGAFLRAEAGRRFSATPVRRLTACPSAKHVSVTGQDSANLAREVASCFEALR